MDDREFLRLCAKHGFEDVSGVLKKWALPCIGFSLKADASVGENCSRFGGEPAVPKDFQWPTDNGRPLDFLLQINLRDTAPIDSSRLLPADGMLSFFYDVESQPWGFKPEDLSSFKICYFPPGVELHRTSRPLGKSEQEPLGKTQITFWSRFLNTIFGTRANEQAQRPLKEMKITFWPAISLPCFGSRAYEQMKADGGLSGERPYEAYDQLAKALFRAAAPSASGPNHKIGGHSDNIQGDMQLDAQLVMNGLDTGDGTAYEHPRRAELEKDCESWRLVLQLDSDDSADVMWGDVGMLYFWARDVDLRKQDFSQVWMALQCF